jgi:DNA polymerase-3 subunit alpha
MYHSDYVPLHVHSEYSLLDGAIKLDELVSTAAEYRMPAVAVTDHGNLFGAVQFYKKAVKAGVKPILGCEVYVAPGSRTDRQKTADNDAAFHLVLLARDNDGYKNLVTLVSRAYTEGFYYRPRIDRELLEQYSGGLIGLTACLQGEVPYHLRRGDMEGAREAALAYKHILGPENFFFELQENGVKEQAEVNRRLVELGRELHIGLVATSDCHYMKKADARAHEILLCIQTGKTMSDPARMRFEGDGLYFRSPEEMKEAFRDIPEAVMNTRTIAERCNVEFTLGASMLPRYVTPDGSRPREFLERLAGEGLRERFGADVPREYTERLERELDVIKKMGYPSYFLIVWDFINYAKQRGIPVGPGRGSAAGSLVAYSLGITEIDPIKYGLLFERFLNPERVSMPDIDVDFCKDRRGDVITYVSDKYGSDHVAQIITFGTMAARAAIRDVARAIDYPYADADRLAKLVPEGVKMTIRDALKLEPQLKDAYEGDDTVRELIDVAMRLEGLARHASTHAAGVVISPDPLTDYTPLYKSPSEDALTTQFDMGSVESMGLIKFDFLGLKTLTILEKTLALLKQSGIVFSLDDIPLDDKKTYEFLGTGQTTGVFQLESDGMKDILVKMQPGRFEDLIALVALYRPGPIKSGMIDDFIKRKKGQKAIQYELPELKDILDETYGVILYQEQVMSIANKLANFTMGQADVLRKAMGKKKIDVMDKQKELFIEGAVGNGIPEKKAARLFDLMAFFAEYGFNKSHSAAYAYISYQTAYLKAHYPVHFMAATLSADLDNSDKIVKSIKECRNMQIPILPPDVNLCGREFTVDHESIRFGLGAVKGAGTAAVDAIITVREEGGAFCSLEDYRRRVALTGKVNKKVNESLVKSGAFDSLGEADGSLAELGRWRAEAMEDVCSANGVEVPSLSLFGQEDAAGSHAENKWDESELLKYEKGALGFYISGNPLSKYSRMLAFLNIRGIAELGEAMDGREVEIAGIVMGIRKIRTKKGDLMASVTLEDEGGSADVIVFPELYKANAGLIEKDAPVLVTGTLECSEKGKKLVARELSSLDSLKKYNGNGMKAVVSISGASPDLKALKGIVERATGNLPLYLKIQTRGAETLIQTSLGIDPDRHLVERIEDVFGKGTIRVV